MQVGISPKRFARITRFQHALRVLEQADVREKGAYTAARCGYADQAHFVRECREISGAPPRANLLPARVGLRSCTRTVPHESAATATIEIKAQEIFMRATVALRRGQVLNECDPAVMCRRPSSPSIHVSGRAWHRGKTNRWAESNTVPAFPAPSARPRQASSGVEKYVRFAALLACALLATPALAQERPLPDAQKFAQEVRKRLATDEERQSGYMYLETRRERSLDKAGRSTRETVKVYESYPALPGEDRWRRLISVDGKPVPASELDKQDRERQKKVLEYVRKLEKQTDRDRAAQAREREKERRESAALVDDVFRVYDIRMLGRETLEGHDAIVFSLTPKRGVKALTRDGGALRHFAAKAWVSETEYELVRLEVEALDNVSYGLGLLARVHKGSHGAFQRRKVNGEEWLPASVSYTGSARLLLLKAMRVDVAAEYSSYRKFTVETETTYGKPK